MIYTAAAVVLLAVLFGFSFFSGRGTSPRNDLDAEAEAKAREYFDRIMARCGGEYYSVAAWTEIVQGKLLQERALFQLKSPTPVVKRSPITEADNLNGIQWHGSLVIITVAHRRYDEYTRRWSEWHDGTPQSISIIRELSIPSLFGIGDFKKQNGGWNSDEPSGPFSDKKPDCSEIPAG